MQPMLKRVKYIYTCKMWKARAGATGELNPATAKERNKLNHMISRDYCQNLTVKI